MSDSEYGIDHIKAKPSLGLAMSGGGFRAATCAAGWARGLHKVTYLSLVLDGTASRDVPLDASTGRQTSTRA